MLYLTCSMNEIVDTLILYTVETGLITACAFLHKASTSLTDSAQSLATIISLICVRPIAIALTMLILIPRFPQWLTMSHNLIFLTLHFTISKCIVPPLFSSFAPTHLPFCRATVYANSFLATYAPPPAFPYMPLTRSEQTELARKTPCPLPIQRLEGQGRQLHVRVVAHLRAKCGKEAVVDGGGSQCTPIPRFSYASL